MPDQVVVPGADEHGVDERRVNGRRQGEESQANGTPHGHLPDSQPVRDCQPVPENQQVAENQTPTDQASDHRSTGEPELADEKLADGGLDVEAGIDQPTADQPTAGQPGVGTDQNPMSASETGPWRQLLRDQVPFGLVLLVAVAGIVRLVEYHWRQGTVLLGAALLVAAVLRAIFPADRAGLLRVRGRAIDVLSYAGLAACMMFVAFTIAGGPLS